MCLPSTKPLILEKSGARISQGSLFFNPLQYMYIISLTMSNQAIHASGLWLVGCLLAWLLGCLVCLYLLIVDSTNTIVVQNHLINSNHPFPMPFFRGRPCSPSCEVSGSLFTSHGHLLLLPWRVVNYRWLGNQWENHWTTGLVDSPVMLDYQRVPSICHQTWHDGKSTIYLLRWCSYWSPTFESISHCHVWFPKEIDVCLHPSDFRILKVQNTRSQPTTFGAFFGELILTISPIK